MEITSAELKRLIYNPIMMQKMILNDLYQDHDKQISNPTSPFMMLLEAAISIPTAQAMEAKNIIRKKFPSLALTKEDLFPHLTDVELSNIFATPATATFKVYMEVTGLKNTGYKPAGATYRETQLPIGTTITGVGKTFTLLNSVLIRLYDDIEIPYVVSNVNENPLGFNDTTIIESTKESSITHGMYSSPFISFPLEVKQVTVKTESKAISKSVKCEITVPLTSKYCYSEVYYNGVTSNNTDVKLEQTFSEEFLDPTKAKVYVTLGDTSVKFTVPDVYIQGGMVSGTLHVKVYETEGDTYSALNNFNPSEFTVTIGSTLTNDAEATAPNLNFIVQPISVLSGGTNGLTMEELKTSVINGTTGPINVPITNYQVTKAGSDLGYSISTVEDSLTKRIYTANKALPSFSSTTIKAMPDIFNNTLGVTLDELKTIDPKLVQDENFMIKAGTVFKEVNGQMRIVPELELAEIEKMDILNKINYYKDNKFFYSLFNYVCHVSDGTTDSKIYHLTKPSMSDLRILKKNLNIQTINAFVSKYTVIRQDNGYRVLIELNGDSGFTSISKNYVKLQIGIVLESGNYVYFNSTFDETLGAYYFDIETDDFISIDGLMTIINGDSDISTKQVPLDTSLNLFCYLTDPNVKDATEYQKSSIRSESNNVTVLFEDKINISFGKEVTYLWNKLFNTYTSRKYRTYKEDVPLLYEEDVYERDVDGNLMFELNQSQNQITVMKLHSKGDPVLDNLGVPVMKHKAGDTVLDEDGQPIIDTISGIIRYIDILMVEYEFLVASSDAQINLMTLLIEYFETMLFKELPSLNQSLLEQTSILYKPLKTTNPLSITSNGTKYNVTYRVSPKIKLYVDQGLSVSLTELESYKTIIGKIINSELDKNRINLNDIKDKIKSSLNIGVNSIQIEGLSPENSEIIVINEESNRLTLEKVLYYTDYNETIVNYNIDISIINM